MVSLTLRIRHIFWFRCLLRTPLFLHKWIAGSRLCLYAVNSFMPGECKYILITAVTASSTYPFLQSDLMILSREKPFTFRGMGRDREQQVHQKKEMRCNVAKCYIYFLPIEVLSNILGTIPITLPIFYWPILRKLIQLR